MEHTIPERVFERQLIERCMFPIFGHLLKMPEFAGLADPEFDPDSDQFMLPQSHLPDAGMHPFPSLCKACDNITMDKLEDQFGYLHSHHVEDLLVSAQTCPLCDMIRRMLCRAVKFHIQSEDVITDARVAVDLFAASMVKNGLFLLNPTPVILKRDRGGIASMNDFVVIGTMVINPEQRHGVYLAMHWGRLLLHGGESDSQLPLLPRGNEEQVLKRLKSWLQVREDEVPSWSDARGDKPLPTRLLDLGSQDGQCTESAESNKIKLVTTAGCCGRYVALSYCWGGYTACQTLRDNYADRCREINVCSLPPMFAQAIRITRGLGLRYLWIDALCIIQEDVDDWKREAARMSMVYSNTTCRLAINDCKSPVESFFPPADIVASVKLPGLVTKSPTSEVDQEVEREDISDDPDKKENDALQQVVGMSLHNRDIGVVGEPANFMVPDHSEDEHRDDLNQECSTGASVGIERGDSAHNNESMDARTEHTGRDQRHPTAFNVLLKDEHVIQRLHPGEATAASSNPPTNTGLERQYWTEQSGDSASGSGWSFPTLGADRSENQPRVRDNGDSRWKGKVRQQSQGMYLTIPKAYVLDVDRGWLNTRAWVLQERLLAPRTIHFTTDHIYCEDQDEICGEDWVKRYFTWLSCIDKSTNMSPVNLFPERALSNINNIFREKASSNTDNSMGASGRDRIWYLRGSYSSSETHRVPDPWLRICEKYTRCNLSFSTDRLAAFAGMVKRYADGLPKEHSINLLGLWKSSLHTDLLWYATRHSKMKYLSELKLPSWAWIAYEGRIFFTKEGRTRRDPRTVRCAPAVEFVLTTSDVPDMMTSLPLCTPATLTLSIRIREIASVSLELTKLDFKQVSREDLASSSPFHFDPRTGTVPRSITSYSLCRELMDEAGTLTGFVSFDEAGTPSGDLFCAHITTVLDEAEAETMRAFKDPAVQSVRLGDFRSPIFAYALVLVKVAGSDSDFRRVGICEVNHEWMSGGTQELIRLM